MKLVCVSYQISHVIPIVQYMEKRNVSDCIFCGESIVKDYVLSKGFQFVAYENNELKNLLQYRKNKDIKKVRQVYKELHTELINIIQLYNITEIYCDISRYMYYSIPGYIQKIKVAIFWTYNGPTHLNWYQMPQTSIKEPRGKILCLMEWFRCFYKNEIKTGKYIFYFFYPYNFIWKFNNLLRLRYSIDGFFVNTTKIVCGPKELVTYYDKQTYFDDFMATDKRKLDASLDYILNENKIKIYISFGTNNARYVEGVSIMNSIISNITQISNAVIIVNIGEVQEENYIKKGNVFFVKNINQEKLVEKMDIIIFHGGFGTLKECLYYKKKMIMIPFLYDQFANAMLIQKKKLGMTVYKEDVRETDFVRLLQKIVEET